VLDHIRAAGMTPWLWLEPEVISVRSPVAQSFPSRPSLSDTDVASWSMVATSSISVIHRPAGTSTTSSIAWSAGSASGTSSSTTTSTRGGDGPRDGLPGASLLGHNRAYAAWIDGVLDRHPALTLENCASGEMRVDYGLHSRMQLQSTSDQQDPCPCPTIASSAATAITPEQAASWAYLQPGFSDDEITLTMSVALL